MQNSPFHRDFAPALSCIASALGDEIPLFGIPSWRFLAAGLILHLICADGAPAAEQRLQKWPYKLVPRADPTGERTAPPRRDRVDGATVNLQLSQPAIIPLFTELFS